MKAVLKSGQVLDINAVATHVLFDNDWYEVCEDQEGDTYFIYNDGQGSHVVYFVAVDDHSVPVQQSYYERQLNTIQPAVNTPYGITVKFTSIAGDTNYIHLNDESASAIVEFLSNNYTLTLK